VAAPTLDFLVLDTRRDSQAAPPAADVFAAIKVQVDEHVLPVWGRDALGDVTFSFVDAAPSTGSLITLADAIDFDGFGYHSVAYNADGRLLYSKILAGASNPAWSITASHEVLEMLLNPFTNAPVCVRNPRTGRGVWREICDPVENCSYKIGAVDLADFVYPAWFGLEYGPQEQYSFTKCATAPFDYASGYIMECDLVAGRQVLSVSAGPDVIPSIFRGPRVTPFSAFLMTADMRAGADAVRAKPHSRANRP
jgi:hypothetical protein